MTGPPLPPSPGTGYENPELRAYVHRRVQEELNRMGAQVDGNYVNEAIAVYMRPGSPLRQEFFKTKADAASMDAKQAQMGGGFGDALERTGRDVVAGAIKGITAPGFFVAKHLGGADNVAASQEALNQLSGEGMGGRGLSSNPILGSIQSAIEPAAEMGANARMIGNRAFQAGGTALTKLGEKFPALAALAPKAGAGVVRNLAPSALQGVFSSAVSMPGETLSPEGLAYGAGMGAFGALAHAKASRPAGATTPGSGLVNRARSVGRSINQFFEEPGAASPDASVAPDIPAIAPLDAPKGVELPVPAAAAPAAAPEVAAPATTASPRPVKATRAEGGNRGESFGGDRVRYEDMDPAQVGQVREFFENMDRTHLLKGKEPQDADLVARVQGAKTIEELPGFLQRRLNNQSGISAAKPAVVAEATQPAEAAAPSAAAPVEAPVATTKASPRKATLPPAAAAAEPVNPPAAAEPVKPTLSLEEQVAQAKAENADLAARYGPGATPRGKPLETTASTEAAPIVEGPRPVTATRASARGKPLETKATAPDEKVTQAAGSPTVSDKKVTPGWWDSEHALPADKVKMIEGVAARRQTELDADGMSKATWDALPPRIRQELSQLDQPGVVPEGGAPSKGAGFQRRPRAIRPPADVPETDAAPKRRPKGKRA